MALCPEKRPELPASPSRILIIALLALMLGLGTAWLSTRPTGPQCVGYLSAHRTFIYAQESCQISALKAAQGTQVRIGDSLVELEDPQLREATIQKKQEIASLTSQLARVEAEASLEMKWRLKTIEAEICELQLRSASFLKDKYDFEIQRTMLSEALASKKITKLAHTPSIQNVSLPAEESDEGKSPERLSALLQLETATNAAEVLSAQLEICEERETSLTALRNDLPRQIQTIMGVDVAREKLQQAQLDLERLTNRESRLTVTSPAIGQVGVYQVNVGDRVQAGDPIVELLDLSRRYLTVHVPSQSIHHFATGTRVTLLFPGNQRRSGEVTQVAPQTQQNNGSTADTTVLVQVEPRGQLWPNLPIGSMIRVQAGR